ncbi:MAG: DUF177 domain-containing protein [Actinomycetota bacterium]|nr:DUF177 domain-containing protein [Actinomycetota bacterium]
MPARTDSFDLGGLHLASGQGRRLDLEVALDSFVLSGERYGAPPVAVILDVARMAGRGYSLRLRCRASVQGPCMRCLDTAQPLVAVDAREVEQPGRGEELDSPYVSEASLLDLRGWVRDALVLALPDQVVCRPECAGLCPVCGASLNADPTHAHAPEPDPRWAKLRELRLD